MTQQQQPPKSREAPIAIAVEPQESWPNGRVVTAHTTLAEPLITVEGLGAVFTPPEAISLSKQLLAACAEICQRRPDIAQRDQLVTMIDGTSDESYRQRLIDFVEAVARVIEDTHGHTPYRAGVTNAMRRLRAEQERLSVEASGSAKPVRETNR